MEPLEVDGAGSFDGKTEGSGPDEVGHASEGSGDSEDSSVVLIFGESEGVEEDTRVSIDVGVGVLDLLVGKELLGDNVSALMEQLDGLVSLQVEFSEIDLVVESGIGVSKHSVSVSWNDTAGGDNGIDVVFDFLVGDISALLLDEFKEPLEDFLVSQSVEGSSETVDTSGVREIRVGQSGTNQVSRVSRHVATFVVAVNGQVTSDALLDDVVVITHHVSVVASPVELRVAFDELRVSVLVSVDDSGDSRDLSDEVHGILVEGLPVVLLGDLTLVVEVSELRVLLQVEQSHREHGHRVEVLGETEDEVGDICGESTSVLPFDLQGVSLFLGGELASHEQPEDTFGERLLVGLVGSLGVSLGQEFLELGNRVVSEDDSLVGVASREITHETLDTSHATNHLLDGVLADNLVAILFLDFLQLSLLLRDDLGEHLLEVRVGAKARLALLEELGERSHFSFRGGFFP